MYFVPYLYRGRSPLYNYNTKYTSLPRVFDTPSSHSNFHPNSNSNSNLNSKLKNKKVFFIFHRDRFLGVDSEFAEFSHSHTDRRKPSKMFFAWPFAQQNDLLKCFVRIAIRTATKRCFVHGAELGVIANAVVIVVVVLPVFWPQAVD